MGKTRAEEKLSEIMDTQHELQAQSEELKRLMEAEQMHDRCNKRKEMLQKRIYDLQDRRKGLDLNTPIGAAEAVKYDHEIEHLHEDLKRITQDMCEFEKVAERLRYIVNNNKKFDKSKLFLNIRNLLSSTGVKLGQIERDAGCQPGYMSRLEKPDNTTDPSMEFVVTAAKALGVSIDFLVYEDYERLTETERYILKFLSNLINDTREDKLVWENYTMGRYVESEQSGGTSGDPLFNYLIVFDLKTDTARYNSLFSNKTVSCAGNSYVAKLNGTDAKIYIMNCADDIAKTDGANQFYEIYILNNKKINPLLSTALTRETMSAAVKQLFEAVEVSAAHLHISSDVRSVIDLYLAAPTA